MFANTIDTDRCKYLSNMVSECNGDQKKLFQVVAFLTGDKKTSSLPDHRDPYLLTNDFGKFFIKKIEKIQKDIDNICESEAIETNSMTLPNQSSVIFSKFDVLSEDDVRNFIMKSASKHCQLDPAPTWLVKKCIEVLLPVITNMINLSLSYGCFPDAWKCALIRPLLKKLGLDFLFKNFRPVSNIPYVSKLTEKAVVDLLNDHTESNELLPEKASAYSRDHSTETALIKVQSDMFAAMDNQHVTLLVMLDLGAAFDTVNHEMLLNKMASRFGISGTVLDWFGSYLDGRKQRVIVNNAMSEEMHLNCGVPQGSCLGPVLFVIYISSLYDVISQHLPNVHGYADDYQLYIWFKPEPVSERESIKAMEMCVSDVRQWMLANRLTINDSKTEVMLVGTRQQLSKVSVEGITVGDEVIASVSTVKNLDKLTKHWVGRNISTLLLRRFREG